MGLTRWKEADNPFLNKMSDHGPSSQRPGRANQWWLFSRAASFGGLRCRLVIHQARVTHERASTDGGAADQGGRRGLEEEARDGGMRWVRQSEEQEEGKRVRRRLRHTGEGSIVTHWPHCQVNATWVFYRRHCSRWHFECTSHTLSLSITHSLHFLGQPPRLTLSRAAALAENSLQDRVVVAAAAEVRGGDEGNDTGFQSRSRRVSFFYRTVVFLLFSWPDQTGEFASAIAVEGSTLDTLKNRLH